jgi:hypothetical protein
MLLDITQHALLSEKNCRKLKAGDMSLCTHYSLSQLATWRGWPAKENFQAHGCAMVTLAHLST